MGLDQMTYRNKFQAGFPFDRHPSFLTFAKGREVARGQHCGICPSSTNACPFCSSGEPSPSGEPSQAQPNAWAMNRREPSQAPPCQCTTGTGSARSCEEWARQAWSRSSSFWGFVHLFGFLFSQAWGMGMPAAVASNTFSFVWEAVWH